MSSQHDLPLSRDNLHHPGTPGSRRVFQQRPVKLSAPSGSMNVRRMNHGLNRITQRVNHGMSLSSFGFVTANESFCVTGKDDLNAL